MGWRAITSGDVLAEFNPKEQALLKGQQGGNDNLPAILDTVVNELRGNVVAGGGQLDQAGTVPDQLRGSVIAVTRWRWLISLPKAIESLQTRERQKAHDDGMDRFERCSYRDGQAGKIHVEVPANPISTKSPAGAMEVARRGARVSERGFGKMGTS